MEHPNMERPVVHFNHHRAAPNKEPKYLDNWSSNNNNNKAAANSAKMETSNNPDHHHLQYNHQYHNNEILTPSASTLLQSRDFKMAVDIMTRWYRAFGAAVKGEELKNFVNCFLEEVLRVQPSIFKQQNGSRNGNNNNSTSNNNVGYFANLDQLSCPICFGILTEPVTTVCGHSYCRKCLQKERSGSSCRRCRQPFTHTDLSTCKLNVLLGSLIEKWWQSDLNAAKFRTEGNSLFEGNDRDRALAKYSQALSLVPTDHLTLGNLSHVLLTLGRSEEALSEIDEAIKNSPFWGKGYFRKSAVLISLGRYEEALVHLAVCAGLVMLGKSHDDPSVTPVKTEMLTVLHRIFLNAVGGGGGGRASSSSSNRRHSCDPNSPYPNFKSSSYHRTGTSEMGTESECSSVEDGSCPDDEDRHRSGGKIMRKRNNSNGLEPNNKSTLIKAKYNNLANGSMPSLGHQAQAVRITRIFDRALGDVKRKYGELRERNSEGTAQICRKPVTATVSAADLECTLCYRLLHEPISTLCGHTFCRSCLERSLDHSTLCPLCKTSLEDYMGHLKPSVNEAIETVITQFLPKDHAERIEQHLEDIAQASGTDRSDNEIPIFVCTMAFPGVPCPLHVFEPKYRLMIRRCMESGTRRFGMCCYVEGGEHNYGDVGTLLEIQNVQYFPDGRSVVDTVGRRRFKVLNKSIKDGYNMARIELLQDRAVEPVDIPQLEAIHNQVYLEAKDWLESVSQVLRQRIVTHFGAMPDPEENWLDSPDGPAWTWWLLAILPLVTKAQVAILGMTGLQRRLESIQKVLRYVTAKQM